jgi:hypothetical protein
MDTTFLNSAENWCRRQKASYWPGGSGGPSSRGIRSYMAFISRPHVALCIEKTRINMAVRVWVKKSEENIANSLLATCGQMCHDEFDIMDHSKPAYISIS